MIFSKKPSIRVLDRRRVETGLFPAEHLLFQVERGLGRLRWVWWESEEYTSAPAALMLGETPLVLLQDSGCPTCASMLGEGYGWPAEDPALRELADRIAAPYRGLEDALERLAPITGLLQSGAFVLTYGAAFPTDGEVRFFWSVPPGPELYAATAEQYESTNFRILPFAARFLYPSQPADRLDGERVEHYRARLRAGEVLPPVLAWAVAGSFGGGGMAVLLDGHHRAAACALEGMQVPCLTISIPVQVRQEGEEYLIWPDGERTAGVKKADPCFGERRTGPRPFPFQEREGDHWPEEYQRAIQRWPTVREATCLSLYPEAELTAEGLRALLRSEEYNEEETVAALLEYAARQPGADIKALALPFTGADKPAELREAAYRVLCQLKDDPEIEKLFIDVYVYEEDNHALRNIADRRWE